MWQHMSLIDKESVKSQEYFIAEKICTIFGQSFVAHFYEYLILYSTFNLLVKLSMLLKDQRRKMTG
jgi:hypothetical protein